MIDDLRAAAVKARGGRQPRVHLLSPCPKISSLRSAPRTEPLTGWLPRMIMFVRQARAVSRVSWGATYPVNCANAHSILAGFFLAEGSFPLWVPPIVSYCFEPIGSVMVQVKGIWITTKAMGRLMDEGTVCGMKDPARTFRKNFLLVAWQLLWMAIRILVDIFWNGSHHSKFRFTFSPYTIIRMTDLYINLQFLLRILIIISCMYKRKEILSAKLRADL